MVGSRTCSIQNYQIHAKKQHIEKAESNQLKQKISDGFDLDQDVSGSSGEQNREQQILPQLKSSCIDQPEDQVEPEQETFDVTPGSPETSAEEFGFVLVGTLDDTANDSMMVPVIEVQAGDLINEENCENLYGENFEEVPVGSGISTEAGGSTSKVEILSDVSLNSALNYNDLYDTGFDTNFTTMQSGNVTADSYSLYRENAANH